MIGEAAAMRAVADRAAAETLMRGKHHPDCPVIYFVDHPERCRCEFMVALDRLAES